LVIAAIAFAVLGLAAGGLLFLKHTPVTPPATDEPAPPKEAPMKAAVADDNTPPPAPGPPAVKRPKSIDDFKFGVVQLDKTKGSSLVYAVGVVTNDSDYQRFGVRVKVDLLNGKGGSVGSAQDYKDIMEPHKNWQFRALVIGGKAASAKVDGVTEEQ
jgi:hypothetical protein